TWKGILAGIVGLALVAGSAPRAFASACGDANNNGGLDAGDGALLLQYVALLNDGTTLCGGAGVNNCLHLDADSRRDASDLVILLNLIAGNPTIFQCTGPGNVLVCNATLSGDLTQNTQLQACTYFVDGLVKIQPNVVLSVAPGATVKGKKTSTDGSPSVLVF